MSRIVCINPQNPDPNPPRRVRLQRWKFFRFLEPLALTISNLSKLAKVTEPRGSALAVYPSAGGEWIIWGLVDQSFNWSQFFEHEHGDVFDSPGELIVDIDGPGIISVYREHSLVACLRRDTLIDRLFDVFSRGPISTLVARYVGEHIARIEQNVGTQIPKYRSRPGVNFMAREAFHYDWLSTLCRLLILTRSSKHGGAFIMLPNDTCDGINLKYRLGYDRLGQCLVSHGTELWGAYQDELKSENASNSETKRPTFRWSISIHNAAASDSEQALAACVRTIASMTQVDGVVVMNRALDVLGFGGEIVIDTAPDSIWSAADAEASPNLLKPISYELYGTRHRSMFRLCNERAGALGLIVSQDGDVRAVFKTANKVVVWDNIETRFSIPLPSVKRSRAKE